jgi:hypothetical protein
MVRFDVVRASITNVFEPAQSNTRVPGTWRGGARKWKEWQNRDSHARFATEPASSSSSRSRAPSAFPAAIPSFSCQSNSSRAKSIPCMTNWSLAPNQRIKVAGPCEMARQSKRTFAPPPRAAAWCSASSTSGFPIHVWARHLVLSVYTTIHGTSLHSILDDWFITSRPSGDTSILCKCGTIRSASLVGFSCYLALFLSLVYELHFL